MPVHSYSFIVTNLSRGITGYKIRSFILQSWRSFKIENVRYIT